MASGDSLPHAATETRVERHGIFALPVDLPLHMHLRDFDDVSEVLAFYKQFDVKVVRFECEEFMAGSRPFIDTFVLLRKPG